MHFICEGADEGCTSLISISLDEYAMNILGHERVEGLIEIMSTNHNHLVVRKFGRAGEIAEDRDTRRLGPPVP